MKISEAGNYVYTRILICCYATQSDDRITKFSVEAAK